MSIQAVAWVLEHSEATLADRLVLIAIANHADARGWNAWPAVPQIAKEARVDRATVFRALEGLEALGEVVIQRRPGRSNMYGLPALGSQSATGMGSQSATGGVASTQKRGRNLQPKPSLTVNEPSAEVAKLPDVLTADVRARGAEFFRALRKGDKPA